MGEVHPPGFSTGAEKSRIDAPPIVSLNDMEMTNVKEQNSRVAIHNIRLTNQTVITDSDYRLFDEEWEVYS